MKAYPSSKEVCLEAEPPRPTPVLQIAEDEAIQVAKFLRDNQIRLEAIGGKASVKDALQLADTIVALATKGKRSSAEQVISIESRVEVFLDLLASKVDGLLAKTK